jgi:hypothetical protein
MFLIIYIRISYSYNLYFLNDDEDDDDELMVFDFFAI